MSQVEGVNHTIDRIVVGYLAPVARIAYETIVRFISVWMQSINLVSQNQEAVSCAPIHDQTPSNTLLDERTLPIRANSADVTEFIMAGIDHGPDKIIIAPAPLAVRLFNKFVAWNRLAVLFSTAGLRIPTVHEVNRNGQNSERKNLQCESHAVPSQNTGTITPPPPVKAPL